MMSVLVDFKDVLIVSIFWFVFVILIGSFFIFKFLKNNSLNLIEFFGLSLYVGLAFWSIIAFVIRLSFPHLKFGVLIYYVLFFLLLFLIILNFKNYVKFILGLRCDFNFLYISFFVLFLWLFYGLKGQGWAWDDWNHNVIISKIIYSGRFENSFTSIFGKDFPIPSYILSSFHFMFAIFLKILGLKYYRFHHASSFVFLMANVGVIYYFLKTFLRENKRVLVGFFLWYLILFYIGCFCFAERFLWFVPLHFFFVPYFISPYVVALLFSFIYERKPFLSGLIFYGYLLFALTYSHILYYSLFLFLFVLLLKSENFKTFIRLWKKYILIFLPGIFIVLIRFIISKSLNPDIYYMVKSKNLFLSQPWAPFLKLPFGVTIYGGSKIEFFKVLIFVMSLYLVIKLKKRSLSLFYLFAFLFVYFPPFGFIWYKILGLWLYARLNVPLGLFIVFPIIELADILNLKITQKNYHKIFSLISLFLIFVSEFIPILKKRHMYGLRHFSVPYDIHYSVKEVEKLYRKLKVLKVSPFSYYWGEWNYCVFSMVYDVPLKAWLDFVLSYKYATMNIKDIKKIANFEKTKYLKEFRRRYDIENKILKQQLPSWEVKKILTREKIKIVSLVENDYPFSVERLVFKLDSVFSFKIEGKFNGKKYWIFKVE